MEDFLSLSAGNNFSEFSEDELLGKILHV